MRQLFLSLFILLPLSILNAQATIQVPGDYATIQQAIDAANNGDLVLVADGTYYENINFKGKAITVASHFLNDENVSHIENTIIDGSQPSHPDTASVVFFISGEDTTSVLCGFTITGGIGSRGQIAKVGGGILLYNSGAQIKNNIIEFNTINNVAWAYGGGIFSAIDNTSNILIMNNIIRNNTCIGTEYAVGGGIKITTAGYALISNNKILENTTSSSNASGGGITVWGPINEVYIVNNYIKGNIVQSNSYGGGGIEIYECTTNTPVIENNIIVDNYSSVYGGGVFVDLVLYDSFKPEMTESENTTGHGDALADQFLVNNTIYNNSAGVSGGGVYTYDMTSNITNCILWGNTAPAAPQIAGTVNVEYSDVEGDWTGTGNIDLNPEFDAASPFYTLLSTSPCIDAGNPDPTYFDAGAGGNPLPPAQGSLLNDMGHCGGPTSLWCYWAWPLPVELTSFTATTQFGKVTLNWTTATEINNLGFEIERKITTEREGQWVRIGFKEGHGTTTEIQYYQFIDDISRISATSLAYRLKQIDFDGRYEYSDEVLVDNPAPTDYSLHQNYPNPFNPITTISFSIPLKSQVNLVVYNSLGESVRQLVNEEKEAGTYRIDFNAAGLPSGVYFYKLEAGNYNQVKKMILLR